MYNIANNNHSCVGSSGGGSGCGGDEIVLQLRIVMEVMVGVMMKGFGNDKVGGEG